MKFEASNTIVGTTSTASVAFGGDPRYFATAPKYSGVVSLIMDRGAAGSFICSGSLLADRRSVLTAGHCVSDGAGTANPISTTAYFYGGSDPDVVPHLDSAGTAVTVSDYFVNAAYTGQVIDQNDIAIVRLSEAAPLFATSYDLYDGGDLTLQDFNVAGYGRRSTVGGDLGVDAGVGRRRQGDNRYEFRLGDPELDGAFDGALDDPDKPAANYSNVYLADFDNGRRANDAACLITGAIGLQSYKFCDLGRGASEASIAPGDSGGPGFINGKIATVTSFGLTYYDYGDIDRSYNSSFGEYGGFVSTAIHSSWISSVMAVPEPSTWAMMLSGFGMMGYSLRRRRAASRAIAA
ncbi:PEPxxWA-CTERM sorting domain-containing protein [Sphingomonas sp. KR1UV-12]|uniref:PEPxxWA-CTERM sorting domain-containing protein n=1 Tax=Sphingomonas aurea TaxID=3063994 RepID=A0ABT9END3_9SPHN|nr:PEPxxWA-CTERM sorting domain-containing protein [Sphingomonas sp. KR1UV-12]MDP1028355.1 PEPxxWA-CTERM sorting domain-containing protein [Sphingomonas sp. KR1UV-12]